MAQCCAALKRNLFTYYDDDIFTTREHIPLYVLMEGRSWGLTSLLITTVALWMVAFDRGETDTVSFLEDNDFFNNWSTELLEYAIYTCLGACAVLVCVGSLHLNLRPPGVKRLRLHIFFSSLCLFAVNCVSGYQAVWSIVSYLDNNDDWVSKPAHGFIIGCAVVCTLLADVLFVQYFGVCMFWNCCALPNTRLPRYNPDLARDLISEDEHPGDNAIPEEAAGVEIESETMETPDPIESPVVQQIDQFTTGDVEESLVQRIDEQQVDVEAEIQIEERVVSSSVGQSAAPDLTSSVGSQGATYRPSSLTPWNTRRVLRRYEEQSQGLESSARHSRAVPGTDNSGPLAEDPVITEQQGDRPRPEDLLWFISNIRTPRAWFEHVVSAVKEEEASFTYSVWIKASCLSTFLVVIYICTRTAHQIYRLCETWGRGIGCLEYNEDLVRNFVRDLGCMSESWRSFLFDLLDYTDTVVPKLKYTVCIGYPIGCFFALHSVYSVMVQYKRLTKALDHEVLQHENLVVPSQKSNIVKDLWPELEKMYPIGGAVYFLGILCSTAVLQLQVFGFLISIVLAVLFNYEKYGYLMEFLGFYILIYIIIFALDWLIIHFLPNRLLSSRYRIKRPRVFFVYMFVFSIVHLVLGFLYAIWRFCHMTLVTFLLINRLDITLSKEFKGLDSGHKAFMSLLVLTNIVQRDKFRRKKRKPLQRVKTAVRRVIRTIHAAASSSNTS